MTGLLGCTSLASHWVALGLCEAVCSASPLHASVHKRCKYTAGACLSASGWEPYPLPLSGSIPHWEAVLATVRGGEVNTSPMPKLL